MPHPLVTALREVTRVLDEAALHDASGEPSGWPTMRPADRVELTEAVALQARLEARLGGLRLHLVSAAEEAQVATQGAETDTSAWAAKVAGNREYRWGRLWLSRKLSQAALAPVSAGLAAGRLTEEHAAVIAHAVEAIPAEVAEQVAPRELLDCVHSLAAKATVMTPAKLRRAARRLLDPVRRGWADAQQAEMLRDEEASAYRQASVMMCDNGDGTWSGRFILPELHARALQKALEVLSSPRRDSPEIRQDRGTYPNRLGKAFCELLEHLPQAGHARSGISLVVHIDEDKLRHDVGAAALDGGGEISVTEARRLACSAGLLPLVLAGKAQPLELGRARRLFSKHQILALSALHEGCAASGCDRPVAWCEWHHREPYGQGGPTDLANAVPLCGHHHRRIHDPHYDSQETPDGSITFTRHYRRARFRQAA